MSDDGFFTRLGKRTGLLIETTPDPPELSDEEMAAAMAALEDELAPPEMPPVTTPAPLGAEIVTLDPAQLIQLLEEELAHAADPAFTLWLKLNEQFEATITDPGQRAVLVVGAMQATHNFSPSNVLWDIVEALRACEDIRAEIEGGRQAAIDEQVSELVESAAAKRAEAAELRQRIAQLEGEAQAEEQEAQARTTAIDTAVQTSIAYLDKRRTDLVSAQTFIKGRHPDAEPVEPEGNP